MKIKKDSKKLKTDYKKLFIILAIIMPIVSLVVILANPNMLMKIKGDISPYIVDGIKSYELGDLVYFDPVRYEICNDDPSSETCYRWMVVNKKNNNYDLFLLNSLYDLNWSSSNPATIIGNVTSNWSDRLTVDSKYDIDVTDSFKLNFSDYKARLLLKSEYNSLPDKTRNALSNYCQKDQYLVVKQSGNTNCGILDTTNKYVEVITSSGVETSFSFYEMSLGRKLNPDYHWENTARPVVNITIDENMGNKDNVIKRVYEAGDIIYFDPVTEDECSETTYDEAKVNKNESTCYRWRVISLDDSVDNNKINIQLDHNIANTRWNRLDDITEEELDRICVQRSGDSCSEYNYHGFTHMSNASMGPKAAMLKLAEVTSTWTRVPLLNYEYDVSDVTPKSEWNMAYSDASNYGVFKCVEGSCSTSHWDISMGTGLRARLITADEVAEIAKRKFPDAVSPSGSYSDRLATDWNHQGAMSHDGSGRYVFSNTSSVLQSKELSWLLENTCSYSSGTGYSGCTGFGRNTNPLHTYYWTLTPVSDGYAGYSYAWNIYDEGYIYPGATNLTDSEAAIRPVIEYDKNYSKVTVTFNDEERLTQTTIDQGAKVEPIDSQGKSGYTFLYWSKRKNGKEFDFTTPIKHDITLYAVYNKKGCNVVDTTSAVEYIEGLYNDDANGNKLTYDNTSDNNLRFIDSNPRNFVLFNNELWRIIGVFNTEDESGNLSKRLKIIRNDYLGNYSWDTSTSDINYGNGINEWSESDIAKLLNPDHDSEENGGSLYWNSASGNCYVGYNNQTSTCDFTTTGLKDDAKDYIDTVKWYTGSYNTNKNDMTKDDMYIIERSNVSGKDNLPEEMTVDDISRTTNWMGKVGLMYPSDYFYAAAGTENDNWLLNRGNPVYTISPSNGNFAGNRGAFFALGISGSSFPNSVYTMSANSSFQIRPTVYLKTNTQFVDGEGTELNPYTLGFIQELECYVTVTYNDEERITERQILDGTTAENIESQGKEGHSFKYWSLDENNEYDFSAPVNEDITLFAVYEPNKYTVEFYDNNEKIDTVEVVWNTGIDTSNIPVVSKEGYDFLGWTEEDSDELFDFGTRIKRNYKLYSKYKEQEKEEPNTPEEKCVLKISSSKYEIDTKNKLINRVPEKETIEDIEKNLVIESEDKQITSEFVRISCKDTVEEYKINRIKILSTGQLRTRYGIILLLISIMTGLLVLSRRANNKLKSMIK